MQLDWHAARRGRIDTPHLAERDVHLLMRQERFSPSAPLKATVLINDDYAWMEYWQRAKLPNPLRFTFDSAIHEAVELSTCQHFSSQGAKAELEFREWRQLPSLEVLEAGTKLRLRAELSGTGVLRDGRNVRYRPDGVVERPGIGLPALEWSSNGTRFLVAIRYHSETGGALPRGAGVLIPVPMIEADWVTQSRITLADAVKFASSRLSTLATVLSFSSRERIKCYRTEIHFNGRDVRPSAHISRLTIDVSHSSTPSVVFDHEILAAGTFANLASAVLELGEGTRLRRALDFVVDAWCARSSAEALVLAHAALEAAVAEASAEVIPPIKWTTLKNAVVRSIREVAADNNLTAGELDSYLEKVPELRRAPIVRSILRTVAESNLDISSIWQNVDEMEADLRRIYSARSRLFHDAQAVDSEIGDAFEKVCHLTELLILTQLGFRQP